MKAYQSMLSLVTVFFFICTPVMADPDCTATGDLSDTCAGTTGLTASVPTGPSGTTYLWTISANGTIVGANDQSSVTYSADSPGLLTLSIQVTDPVMVQCTEDYPMTVFSNPSADILADGSPASFVEACNAISVALDGNPNGGSGSYSQHIWTGSGTTYLTSTTIQNPDFTCSVPGTYVLTYTVTDSNGCQASDTLTIVVHPNPVPDILANGSPGTPADACVGVDLFLEGNPGGGSGTFVLHEWTGTGAPFLSSTSIENPVFNCSVPGSYSLNYRVVDDMTCEGQDTITIDVYQNPTVDILIEGSPDPSGSVCAGSNLALDGNPSGGSGTYAIHSWTGSGAAYLSSTSIQSPMFNSNTPGLYNLTYTVTDSHGCMDSDTVNITVNISPTADITSNGSPISSEWLCLTEMSQLNGNPSGGSGTYISHTWSGDTSPLSATTIPNPTFQTAVPGDYNLVYTVVDSNGCSGTDSISIHVENPVCDILANGSPGAVFEVCAGITVDLNGNPSGGSGGYSHLWAGDTGPLNQTDVQQPDFNTNTAGTYILSYTVTDNQGCAGMDSISITVHPNPVVDILMAGIPVNDEWLCIDEPLSLDGNPSGGSNIFVSHAWSGSGAVHLNDPNIQAPVFQSAVAGIFTLYYQVTDSRGCIDTDSVTIVVADPIPDIEVNGTAAATYSVCAGQGLILDGNPKDGSRTYVNHAWTGDTTPLDQTDVQAPIFNTPVTGSYNLTYTVTDDEGCIGTDIITITVTALPVADAGLDTGILYGESVVLDAAGSSCTGGCDYYWEVADGDTTSIDEGQSSAQCTVSPNYATVYQVTVTDANGCSDYDIVVVTVGDIPIPSMTLPGIFALLALLGGFLIRARSRHPAKHLFLCVFLLLLSTGISSAQTTRFVNPASGFPSPPYTNWDNAAHTIQAAIDGCGTGDTIFVANGVYSENLQLNKEITIRSWCMDPELCVISATNPIFPAVEITDPDIFANQIVLAGFKIEGGSKAVYLEGNFSGDEFPLIRNCIVADYPGVGIHCYNAGFYMEFCTLVNNNVGLFAEETRASSRGFYNIVSGNALYGFHIDASYFEMRNNCFYDNGQHIFGSPTAYCDEWSVETLPNGVDPQFIPGTYKLADTSPCKDFIQPVGHPECNDILFDINESPYDLGAYGGYGSPPLPPFIDLETRVPEPGDYRIAANAVIDFTIWDEGSAGLDLNTLTVQLSNHGHAAETFTQADLIISPVPIYGVPPQDCQAMGYEVTLPGIAHNLFADFAYVRVDVSVFDRNPVPSFYTHHWEFHADDLNPPIILPGFYPGQGEVGVPVYGPIEMDLDDAGVGYDPDSLVFTLNSDPVSLNLSEITWTGDHLTLIPRPRFIPGVLNTLTFQISDYYGNTLPVQTVNFTCEDDTDAPFVSHITGPSTSPLLPALAPSPDPDDGSSDADIMDPITFSLQDFSTIVNLINMEVEIDTGTNIYRYYLEPQGGSSRVFQVTGDPMARRISCNPVGGWPLNRTITVTITGGADTAAIPNIMQPATYSFQCGTAPIPSTSTVGVVLLLIVMGTLIGLIPRR